MKKLYVIINVLRFWPHLLLANASMWKDVEVYAKEYKVNGNQYFQLLWFLTFNRSFRSLYYYRLGAKRFLVMWLGRGESNFHIPQTCKIAPGVLFFHSYGTILNGWSIGTECRITHNVTLGDKHGMRPHIGERVEILPGAVIVGDVTVGNDCVLGPNAVVYKSVPDNCIVVGNPAYILKENGIVVNRSL